MTYGKRGMARWLRRELAEGGMRAPVRFELEPERESGLESGAPLPSPCGQSIHPNPSCA